jgi:copper chaperone
MESKKFSIPNISCHHCVMNIKRDLGEVPGVKKIDGDPGKKEITVSWDAPATLEKVKAALKEINYPPAE